MGIAFQQRQITNAQIVSVEVRGRAVASPTRRSGKKLHRIGVPLLLSRLRTGLWPSLLSPEIYVSCWGEAFGTGQSARLGSLLDTP